MTCGNDFHDHPTKPSKSGPQGPDFVAFGRSVSDLAAPTKKMTRQEEHDFYADPDTDNQTLQGPALRRRPNLSEPVPVRFPPETLAKIRDAADAEGRSVSSWIRRAVDHELEHDTQTA